MKPGRAVQDYARPQTLSDAFRLMADGGWRLLAGGTDLYPGAGRELSGSILDLTGLPGFASIEMGREVRIGAAVPWSAIIEAELPPALRALQVAARQVGGRQVQNTGTIGGNLCNASPAADGVPPLLVAGAEVEMVSAARTRRVPLSEFILGPRRTDLRPGEILAAVVIPATGMSGTSAFLKLGARRHLVISIAMVAVRLVVEAGRVAEAAVAVGSCSAVAVRLAAIEAKLRGASVAEAVGRVGTGDVQAALAPIDDVRATAAYRQAAAVELVRRAVAEALP
jgi:CO/xanthine dehydrogenase FAD-binding subunit